MNLNCPCCRIVNDCAATVATCRRCRADLSTLVLLETERERLLKLARREIRAGRLEQAVTVLEAATQLRPGSDAARLHAVILLLQRRYSSAWQAYHKI